MLVSVARRDAAFFAETAALRMQIALLVKEKDAAQKALEAFSAYSEAMLPYVDAGRTSVDDQQRLLEHVKQTMQIDTQMMRHEQQQRLRNKGLDKFRIGRA